MDILKSVATPEIVESTAENNTPVFVLNVPLLEPRLKHATVFKHFDALQAGEAFQILNDHDPKPLYYQLIAERGNTFSWRYLQKGPQWWQVEMRKAEAGLAVGELAAADGETIALYNSDRDDWMARDGDVFFITGHYKNHPMLLVDLKRVSKDDLKTLVQTSWTLRAPKKLRIQYLSGL